MSDAGSFYTSVYVYSAKDAKLLTNRQGAYPDVSKGYWKIAVQLQADRSKVGTLKLYDAGGNLVQSCSALGQSASNESMSTYQGNTPIGNYYGNLGSVQSNTESYGPYKVVMLTGNNNAYVPKYRDGIWIHGGRNQTTLSPTYGCVRIFNSSQKTLANNIINLTSSSNGHYSQGNVAITQQ